MEVKTTFRLRKLLFFSSISISYLNSILVLTSIDFFLISFRYVLSISISVILPSLSLLISFVFLFLYVLSSLLLLFSLISPFLYLFSLFSSFLSPSFPFIFLLLIHSLFFFSFFLSLPLC